jgi:hypothetical protein
MCCIMHQCFGVGFPMGSHATHRALGWPIRNTPAHLSCLIDAIRWTADTSRRASHESGEGGCGRWGTTSAQGRGWGGPVGAPAMMTIAFPASTSKQAPPTRSSAHPPHLWDGFAPSANGDLDQRLQSWWVAKFNYSMCQNKREMVQANWIKIWKKVWMLECKTLLKNLFHKWTRLETYSRSGPFQGRQARWHPY